jgi:hypothetical protein
MAGKNILALVTGRRASINPLDVWSDCLLGLRP